MFWENKILTHLHLGFMIKSAGQMVRRRLIMAQMNNLLGLCKMWALKLLSPGLDLPFTALWTAYIGTNTYTVWNVCAYDAWGIREQKYIIFSMYLYLLVKINALSTWHFHNRANLPPCCLVGPIHSAIPPNILFENSLNGTM